MYYLYLFVCLSRHQWLSDSHMGHDHVDRFGDSAHSRNGLRHRKVVVKQKSLLLGAVEGAPDASDAGLGRCQQEEATRVPYNLSSIYRFKHKS